MLGQLPVLEVEDEDTANGSDEPQDCNKEEATEDKEWTAHEQDRQWSEAHQKCYLPHAEEAVQHRRCDDRGGRVAHGFAAQVCEDGMHRIDGALLVLPWQRPRSREAKESMGARVGAVRDVNTTCVQHVAGASGRAENWILLSSNEQRGRVVVDVIGEVADAKGCCLGFAPWGIAIVDEAQGDVDEPGRFLQRGLRVQYAIQAEKLLQDGELHLEQRLPSALLQLPQQLGVAHHRRRHRHQVAARRVAHDGASLDAVCLPHKRKAPQHADQCSRVAVLWCEWIVERVHCVPRTPQEADATQHQLGRGRQEGASVHVDNRHKLLGARQRRAG
mmetsp:Transcript_73492/g.185686  ORF Transcript_73492/g.185686 Transcript_73492/m.185686 type:complete len:331 (+) Transcript_73492:360-1352(+)